MKLVPRHKGWTIYASWTINFSVTHLPAASGDKRVQTSGDKRVQTNESLIGYRHWLKCPT